MVLDAIYYSCLGISMTGNNFTSACWGALAILSVLVPACDQIERELQRRCDRAEEDYRAQLAEEKTELAQQKALPEENKRPAHFGLTLSNDLLSQLADHAVEPMITAALEFISTVEVGGQSVELRTDGDVVDLTLGAHDACANCFQIGVDLDGAVVADAAAFGRREAQLGGGGKLVAPLKLTRGDDKTAAVKLALGQLAEIGASEIDARLSGMSSEWRQRLEEPLSRLIRRMLIRRLESVTIAEFDGPSFGIDGFELTPVALQSDAEHGAVFAGFSTNVEALNAESVAGIASVTDLKEGQNIALSFQPQLVVRVLSLLIKRGDVARRYTSDGEASERGGFHVTLDDFRVGADAIDIETGAGEWNDVGLADAVGQSRRGDAGQEGGGTGRPGGPRMPVALEFGVHQFGDSGLCFNTQARMSGGMAVRSGNLQVGVDDVRVTGGGVPAGIVDLANWTSAQFIRESRTIVDQSLDGEHVSVPGTALKVGPLAVGVRSNTIVLRGNTN